MTCLKRIGRAGAALLLAGALGGCAAPSAPEPDGAPAQRETPPASETASADDPQPAQAEPAEGLLVSVRDGEREVVFALNESAAAASLSAQLPLSVEVSAYADNEMIFYPPEELDVSDAPPVDGPAGTLAYYAPWGDVVMFYGECGPHSGLYELGEAVSGAERIPELSGTIEVALAEG